MKRAFAPFFFVDFFVVKIENRHSHNTGVTSMKPFTHSTHGRNHVFGTKSAKVPKRSAQRRGTRTALRQKMNNALRHTVSQMG